MGSPAVRTNIYTYEVYGCERIFPSQVQAWLSVYTTNRCDIIKMNEMTLFASCYTAIFKH
jgi:hypothetical protein